MPTRTEKNSFKTYTLPQLDNLYGMALCVLNNESDAQAIVQESFVRAYRLWNRHQFIPDCPIWLFGIMTDLLVEKFRGIPDAVAEIDRAEEIEGYMAYSRWVNQYPPGTHDRIPMAAISENDLIQAIRSLPDDIRLITTLSMMRGFSYREISEIAKISLETVKSGLNRGRKLLQRRLFATVGDKRGRIYDKPQYEPHASNKIH